MRVAARRNKVEATRVETPRTPSRVSAQRAKEADKFEAAKARKARAAAPGPTSAPVAVPPALASELRAELVAKTGASWPVQATGAAPAPQELLDIAARLAARSVVPWGAGLGSAEAIADLRRLGEIARSMQPQPTQPTQPQQPVPRLSSMRDGYYVPVEPQASKYPPALEGETLAQYALRTAPVTGLPVAELGALLHLGNPNLPPNATLAQRVDGYLHPTAYWPPAEIDRMNQILYTQRQSGISFSPAPPTGAKPPPPPPPPTYAGQPTAPGAPTYTGPQHYVREPRQAQNWPPVEPGETLAQYALRTAAVTGFRVEQLGALLHMGASPDLPPNHTLQERLDAFLHPTAYWSDAELARQNAIRQAEIERGIGFSPAPPRR